MQFLNELNLRIDRCVNNSFDFALRLSRTWKKFLFKDKDQNIYLAAFDISPILKDHRS